MHTKVHHRVAHDRPTLLRSTEAACKHGSSCAASPKPAQSPGPRRPHRARTGHAGGMMNPTDLFIGIDVAKAQVDIAVRPTGETWMSPTDEAGLAALVQRLQPVRPTLIVLEATGGWEIPVAGALAAAGLPVAVVNPRQVRAFAKATGRLAKTDRLDAQVLAQFAEAVRPTPRPLPDATAQELSAILARRRQLIDMLTAEKHRLSHALARVQPDIRAHIAFLEKRLARADDDLASLIRTSPLWREQDDR